MNRFVLFHLFLFFLLFSHLPSASAETRRINKCRAIRTLSIGVSLNVLSLDTCSQNLSFRLSQKESEPIAKFCPALREVLLSGWKKFKPIRGKLDLVSEEYFGTLILPGQEICYAWLDGSTYHCRSREGLSLSEVGTLYEAYTRSIRLCLSQGWTEKEVTVDRVNARRSTTYKSDLHRVEIQVGERNKRTGWQVVLYFRR